MQNSPLVRHDSTQIVVLITNRRTYNKQKNVHCRKKEFYFITATMTALTKKIGNIFKKINVDQLVNVIN